MGRIRNLWKKIKVEISLWNKKFVDWLFDWKNGTKR